MAAIFRKPQGLCRTDGHARTCASSPWLFRSSSNRAATLPEILEGLAKVIRSRFKLFRRVKAITAEAKWSGMFLSVVPDRCAGDDPECCKTELLRWGQGHPRPSSRPVSFVATFLTINVIFMKMMVNIKV